MTSAKKCMICRTSEDDILNLGEMKTYENISVHYYCLLLSSTIKQSGEDDEGILGFLPSDIKEEMKTSQQRICVYCNRRGASVLCSSKVCKVMFHLPCGLKNESGHQFHGRFLSNCRAHRPKQKFKTPAEPQTCPVCYENVDFKNWAKILWAPCCKKQSFFHKSCIQQMALSAGYFFKCPMCNNCEVFQKAMKHYGVFIPDRDASWELEPNAFEELLYRHTECNAQICLCKSGRNYNNLGPWNIILCTMCGSQGTHRHCSKLRKNEDWICNSCFIEKNTENTSQPKVINGVQIIPIFQPSTSNIMNPVEMHQIPNQQQMHQIPNHNTNITNTQSKPKKRKRNRRLRSDTNLIEIDSEDSDVVIIEEEPTSKCLIAQDRSLLRVRNNIKQKNIDFENQDSSSCSDFMNLVITDVRSLSETKNEFIENITPVSSKSFNAIDDEFKNIQNKIVLSATVSEQQQEQQQQFMVLQDVVYKNNNNSIYQQSNNQHVGSSSSSDDIVIID